MKCGWLFKLQRHIQQHPKSYNQGFLRVLCGYFSKPILAALLVLLTSCAQVQSLAVTQAQTMVAEAWNTHQHGIWVLDWPAAPVGGPVTVETWRAGDIYRYEVLEAVAPALIGETLVFNGQTTWRYNRFDSVSPVVLDSPHLSPISDAFAAIDRLTATLPQLATQEATQTSYGPAQKISLSYTNGDQLIVWRDGKTQLPVKVVFSVYGQQATLNARDVEPLVNPPERLFAMP
jgi:hypothetical protein